MPVVVGSGPNGLAAAIVHRASAGRRSSCSRPSRPSAAAMRSAKLTLPGFVHDVCSAIHPFAVASPFFQDVAARAARPRVDRAAGHAGASARRSDRPAAVYRSVERTAAALGADASGVSALHRPYRRPLEPRMEPSCSGRLRWPAHPVRARAFGLRALRSAEHAVARAFRREPARALFAGIAAHGMLPLDRAATAVLGLVLGAMPTSPAGVTARRRQSIAERWPAHLR